MKLFEMKVGERFILKELNTPTTFKIIGFKYKKIPVIGKRLNVICFNETEKKKAWFIHNWEVTKIS